MRSSITNIGRELLARLELNEISMEFTEIRTGSGVYGSSEVITTATSLKSEKNVFPISASEATSSGFMLTAGISNVDSGGQSIVDESYKINEIGVYVTVEGEKYLYMLAVQDGNTGNVLPAYNGTNAIDYVEKFLLTISNTANVTVNMTGAYALSEDVLRWISEAVSEHAELAIHLTAEERIAWNGKADGIVFDDSTNKIQIKSGEDVISEAELGSSASHDATDEITEDSDDVLTSGAAFSGLVTNRGTWVEITIEAANWDNDEYSFEGDYPSTAYDILDIMPYADTTDDMRKAWARAQCGGYEATNKITAHGKVPTIDLDLIMWVREKM